MYETTANAEKPFNAEKYNIASQSVKITPARSSPPLLGGCGGLVSPESFSDSPLIPLTLTSKFSLPSGVLLSPAPQDGGLVAKGGVSSYQPETDLPTYQQSTALGSYRISQRFEKYLRLTAKYKFRLTGKNNVGEVVKTVPYIHRWTGIYQKSILAKFYALEKWLEKNPGKVTMFTLTTYQGSNSEFNDGSYSQEMIGHRLTIGECFDLLKNSREKLLSAIRMKHPGTNYVWVLEPHKTGFPHCHLIVFGEFTELEQKAIKTLWNGKYNAGSYAHGVEITSKNSDESVLSIRNYLMKYMEKQFGSGEPWTKGELLFNAMVWDTGSRMWGASKELTEVMKKPIKENDVVWDIVELITPGCEFEVWKREDREIFPDLFLDHEDDDNDNLCPESKILEKFWIVIDKRPIYDDKNNQKKLFDFGDFRFITLQ